MANDTTTLNLATTAGDKLATDTLTTMNGVAAPAGAKAQYAKAAYGAPGALQAVDESNPMPVNTLAQVGLARQLAAGAASANTALTAGVRRISIFARLAAARYAVGSGAQTASATTHYLALGERIDIAVPATGANIAVMRADAADGVVELSELA